jgi:hypothetical protein
MPIRASIKLDTPITRITAIAVSAAVSPAIPAFSLRILTADAAMVTLPRRAVFVR